MRKKKDLNVILFFYQFIFIETLEDVIKLIKIDISYIIFCFLFFV